MSPEQARWLYARMTPEQKDGLRDVLAKLPEVLGKFDQAITKWAQHGADEAEAYANAKMPPPPSR